MIMKMGLACLILIYLTTIAEMKIMELMINQLDLLLLLQFIMLLYLKKLSICVHNSMKAFLVNLITGYLKKTLKYAGQNCDDHPSVVVTASTGKAATNTNCTTLHSAFSLPAREGSFNQGKLGKERLHELQMKYQHLKVLLSDEISMIEDI